MPAQAIRRRHGSGGAIGGTRGALSEQRTTEVVVGARRSWHATARRYRNRLRACRGSAGLVTVPVIGDRSPSRPHGAREQNEEEDDAQRCGVRSTLRRVFSGASRDADGGPLYPDAGWGGARTGPEYPPVRCLLAWGVAQAYFTDMPRIAALRKALQSIEQGQPHPIIRHIG
jgi:hypothetical protein